MARVFPDLQLHLDPQFAPPPSTSLVPPLSLDPSLGGGMGPAAPWMMPPSPSLLPPAPNVMSDVFSHYADPGAGGPGPTAMDAVTGALGGLATRPGLQADRDGVGTTTGDWRLRFMPYIPFLNEP